MTKPRLAPIRDGIPHEPDQALLRQPLWGGVRVAVGSGEQSHWRCYAGEVGPF